MTFHWIRYRKYGACYLEFITSKNALDGTLKRVQDEGKKMTALAGKPQSEPARSVQAGLVHFLM